MLLVKDDFSRFSAVCFMRSKNEASKYFKQYLADHRVSGAPPVETVRTDDAAEFKSGYFADLCRERGIRQESTTANSPQFNGVAEMRTTMKRVNREGSLNSSEMYVLWYGHSVE